MILLCLLFVLSGLAGLMLETVFLRQLAWLFGNSTTATVAVLTAFMAGLAIGATTLGRVADRRDRPLRMYGVLELGTALSGGGLAWLLGSGRELFIQPLRALGDGPLLSAASLLLAFVLMLIPTVLMGGTLPALSRLVVRDLSRFAGSLGWLYAINTLGAAAGVFLAGFWCFELLGVSRTAYLESAGGARRSSRPPSPHRCRARTGRHCPAGCEWPVSPSPEAPGWRCWVTRCCGPACSDSTCVRSVTPSV
jgi:spermidine synthase